MANQELLGSNSSSDSPKRKRARLDQTEQPTKRLCQLPGKSLLISPPRTKTQRLCPPTPRCTTTDCQGQDWQDWDKPLPFADPQKERSRQQIDDAFDKIFESPVRKSTRNCLFSAPATTSISMPKTPTIKLDKKNNTVKSLDFGGSKKLRKPLHITVRNKNFLSSQSVNK